VELSDGAVVRRVLEGETELYGVLVERYRKRLGRYAVGFVRDRDAAADAMQEAFIRAYDALPSCRDPDRFGAWFFRILSNQCREAVARRRDTVDISVVDPPSRHFADGALERTEIGVAIADALAELTPEQREAFVLKHVDGRSYEEMTELLGVGVDALKMRVYRARDALRAALGDRLG
jgi:RNA polymerase sigma-70 factor (ECF subfamily)